MHYFLDLLADIFSTIRSFFVTEKDALQGFSYFATAFSAIGAFATYIANSRREKRRNRDEIYDKAGAAFIKLNEMIIEHPELDVYYDDLPTKVELNDKQKIQQWAIYDIFVSTIEIAFLAYKDATSEQRLQQWNGWEAYIFRYCAKKSFREFWFYDRGGGYSAEHQFDTGFQRFMEKMLAAAQPQTQPTACANDD
ncbi:MAG: hypothetical protein ACLPX9_07495 [Rhodomicrobium sp.]